MMLRLFSVCVLTAFVGFSALFAQTSWKQRLAQAEAAEAIGDYENAAAFYESAHSVAKKSKKNDIAYKAAETYMMIRDYRNAAKMYDYVKGDNGTYDKPGLKYAQALKQSGDCEAASKAFVIYLNNYTGSDYDDVSAEIDQQVKGCDLLKKTTEEPYSAAVIKNAGVVINTPGTDYAAVASPVDGSLYYSTTGVDSRSRIVATSAPEGKWLPSRELEYLHTSGFKHFGNGSISQDGQRFYYTQCNTTDEGEPRCQIFYTFRNEKGNWSKSRRLPDFINADDATQTHPSVGVSKEIEYLYFSSNREGGKGGMDIWYTYRKAGDPEASFRAPVNAGDAINTAGDEVTPYYVPDMERLFFSTNGHPSIGGLDVYTAAGETYNWSDIKHLGQPINSSADDHYFYVGAEGNGYMSSNRAGVDRLTTADDDIYSVELPSPNIVLTGLVRDPNGAAIKDVEATLFKVKQAGNVPVLKKTFPKGVYSFSVKPGEKYQVMAGKVGYLPQPIELNTASVPAGSVIEQDITLERAMTAIAPPPVVEVDPVVTAPAAIPDPTYDPVVVADPPPVALPELTPPSPEPVYVAPEPVSVPTPEPVVVDPAPVRVPEPSIVVPTPEPVYVAPEPVAAPTPDPTYVAPTPQPLPTETELPSSTIATSGSVAYSSMTAAEKKNLILLDGKPFIKTESGLIPVDGYTGYTSSASTPSSPVTTTGSYPSSTISSSSGEVYKIQLAALKTPDYAKFQNVEHLGRLHSEPINDLYRIFIGDYYSKEEALQQLREVRATGNKRAFVIRYVDGVRAGKPIKR